MFAHTQGVFLRKNVIEVAGRALKANISALAPSVLSYSELVGALPTYATEVLTSPEPCP